jgi:hypothetical protein
MQTVSKLVVVLIVLVRPALVTGAVLTGHVRSDQWCCWCYAPRPCIMSCGCQAGCLAFVYLVRNCGVPTSSACAAT